MKTLDSKTSSQELAGNIQLARLRVTLAESNLKSAQQQARLARRRHKEAKRTARCAKKAAKLAKQELAEAKLGLAQAEAKPDGSRAITTKTRRSVVLPRKTARPASSPFHKSVEPARPSSSTTKSRRSAKPRDGGLRKSIPVPQGMGTPMAALIPGREELRVAERESVNAVAAARSEGPANEEEAKNQ